MKKRVKFDELGSYDLFLFNKGLYVKVIEFEGYNAHSINTGIAHCFRGEYEVEALDLSNIGDVPYVPFPIAFHTVDIIATRDDGFGGTEVLLGRKPNQTKWQFIGGFVEPEHTTEHTAAKEFNEEAGVLIDNESRFNYLGSMVINDARYIDSPHNITTSIFTIKLTYGEANRTKAGDDIEELKYCPIDKVSDKLRDLHKDLFIKFLIWHFKK